MKNLRNLPYLQLFSLILILNSCSNTRKNASANKNSGSASYSLADFATVRKFDTHVHLNTYDTPYIQQAIADNFRMLDIVDDRPFGIPMADQEKIAIHQVKAFPGRIVYATTFSVKNWNDADWQQQAIDKIKSAVSDGAVAVKIWKNVGMDLKDSDGK